MNGGAGGYITDLVYPDFFHRETSPVWIAGAMAAIGQRTPALDRPWRYLDLGCGTGYGTALLAAANPGGQFVGVDINPRHIERGRAMAAHLANLKFIEAGFGTLAEQGERLEAPFDFIVLHGIYSWLSAEECAAIHRLMERWLVPGGIVYLHYSTHPRAVGLRRCARHAVEDRCLDTWRFHGGHKQRHGVPACAQSSRSRLYTGISPACGLSP